MHREPLLKLLDHYGLRFPEEAPTVERFRNFVTSHRDCFERSLAVGHITASAWITDAEGASVLLTNHRKLNRWLQPGGHADGDTDALAVALKEAAEETGLSPIKPVSPEIFDLDIHEIPERKSEPAHLHYDVRFALVHRGDGRFVVSEESHDLAWVSLKDLSKYTTELSITRMAEKHFQKK